MRNVYVVLSQGNAHRDLIRLGMLNYLLETAPDIRVILLTQAYAVPEVLEEVRHERVLVRRHDLFQGRFSPSGKWPRGLGTVVRLRQQQTSRRMIDLFLQLEARMASAPVGLEDLFDKYPPSLMVSTHPLVVWEWDVVSYARKWGVKTAGIVKSWDNIVKRLYTRTDYLAVWNKANYREAIDIERYREDQVSMVGATAFDRYFNPSVIRPRDEFWRSMGLDPENPIVLFGTAGSHAPDWDETHVMDLLLQITDQCAELRSIQFVCRLHPSSRLEHFWPYHDHPRVILSFGSYVKTLGWCMTKDEVDQMANMLCHADLVITPASTLSIEAPVFDTPTLVTLFSTVRPELHAKATKKAWLEMHFKPIVEHDWLPLVHTSEDLAPMMTRALQDPAWYREGRKAIVEEYITLTDGKSYQRVAQFISDLAH